MKLTILERGDYFCFLNGELKDNKWIYRCELSGAGRFGWKSSSKANQAEIFDNNNKKVGSIYFWRRLFHPHVFRFELENGLKIEVQFEKKWPYLPLTFKYNNDTYRMVGHRGHYRILYRNNIQVASFDKDSVTFFNRDCFITLGESDLNKLLLLILSVFDDIWNSKDATVTYDFGDIGYPKAPDNKKWRPK